LDANQAKCGDPRLRLGQSPEIEPRINRLMTTSLTPLDLAALLCSRVCHDVISPVGAIINGLEVLDGEEDEEMRSVAMELIKKSAISAAARLQFCRLAFGAAGSYGAMIDTGDAEKAARDLFANGRTALEWRDERRMASRNSVKLLLNLCLIAAGAVPRGGVITVDLFGEGDAMAMRVEAKGLNARLSHSAADFLSNAPPKDAVDGHSIQLYFTTLLARECDATLNVSTGPECVTLATVPAPRLAEAPAAVHPLNSPAA
jgi:histidine phosphotransferase ChpT